MPTDLPTFYAEKRRVQAQTQAEFEMALMFVLIVLLSGLVLYVDESFAQTTIGLMAFY